MSTTQSGYSVIRDYGDPQLLPNPSVPGAPGVAILGGLRRGSVATCLLYVAGRFHAEVEHLVQADGCWGYDRRTIGASGTWSNHSAGAAMDLNATRHPQHAAGTFTGTQLKRIDLIAAAVGPAIEWGGYWGSADLDAMHWQVANGAAGALVDRLAGAITAGFVPSPRPPSGPPLAAAPYPFVRGDGRYFGPYSGPAQSISGSGSDDARYRPPLALWQAQAARRGHGPRDADGYYGPATAAAARSVQATYGLEMDGLIGWDTWFAVWR